MEQVGGTVLRVLPRADRGWEVKEPGSSSPVLSHRATRPEAIEAAQALLSAGGTVQVIDAEGFVEQTLPVLAVQGSSRSPEWWHQSKGLRLVYLLLGVSMTMRGVLQFAFHRAEGVGFWWACVQLAAGLAFLVLSIVAGARHRRSLKAAAARLEAARRPET